jgi:3-hydroxyisobutyrate dehydrogenase-like beta-hydroxyacid dehydrogenase
MDNVRWGVIGFGEAGSAFARHISCHTATSVQIADPLLNRVPQHELTARRLVGLDCKIVSEISQLVADCDLVLSLVTPSVAMNVAGEAGSAWRQGVFVELNSVSPAEKQRMAEFFKDDSFVDGSILGSISGQGTKSPLALSGPRARQAQAWLLACGFNASVASSDVGGASALKMCRSVFMKGVECLFVETLLAAAQSNVTEAVLSSIEETFLCYDFRPLANILVTTHAAHCGRRSHEMLGVTKMLKELHLPHEMSAASSRFLAANHKAGLTDYFEGTVPDDFESVISYLQRFYVGGKQ